MNVSPPVISDIAKAYQNDPKTKLALEALTSGSSTSPVATGNNGYLDGIARVLRAGIGGAVNKSQENQYTHGDGSTVDTTLTPGSPAWVAAQNARGQDGVLAIRQQRGADGLSGQLPAVSSGMPQAQSAQAAQLVAAANALGSPPPAQGPSGPPPAAPMAGPGGPPPPGGGPPPPGGAPPMAPIPAAAPPMAGPGGAQVLPPFTGTAPAAAPPNTSPGGPVAPVMEAIPAGPAPVARPNAPTAVAPVQSKLLTSAYKIMQDANPYESDAGQDQYTQGLSDQDKLNEEAAKRLQEVQDIGYKSDLGSYADAQQQDRGATIASAAAAQQRNFQATQKYGEQQFQSGQTDKEETFQGGQNNLTRANERTLEGMRTKSAMAVALVKAQAKTGAGGTALTDEERAAVNAAVSAGKLDPTSLRTAAQTKTVASALVANPDIDAIHLHAYANLAASPPAQQKAQVLAALPTIVANVRDAGKKLNLSDTQFAGKLQAFTKGQLNDPDFVNYMTQRNDAVQTLSSVMRNTGATDLSTKLESDAAPRTLSPRALDAWYAAQMTALKPRIQIAEKKGLIDKGTTASLYPDAAPAAAPGKTGNPLVDKYL